ncbi:hypothetical protein M569_10311 [Genlisea aurea]|uniref:Phytochromobilin synthase n=1 Tax=Genlisea aurea TaxID=192259 RepID=S8CBZ0_9LAMI|nr:hypothetical protein M569_10311 [Genlisea aurea]
MESCSFFPLSSPANLSNLHHFPLKNGIQITPSPISRRLFSFPRAEASYYSSPFSYENFVQFAVNETGIHTHLKPSPLQEKFRRFTSTDGKSELRMQSFDSPKIRLLRSLSIDRGDEMQVLDLAIFPRSQFDLPIFCGNFFTTPAMNIVVLDLNPLHDVISRRDYKEKYYRHLIPLWLKYADLLPWGGKITTESLNFFSPIVIWSKFTPSSEKQHALYSAFKDYLKAWLLLMDRVTEETCNNSSLEFNLEAQHRYLTWRAEKEPGHHLLKKLLGETLSKEVIRGFLFNGVDSLGSKTLVDYFPEYRCDDGTTNQKRSIVGKSFETRPWDASGEFIGKF